MPRESPPSAGPREHWLNEERTRVYPRLILAAVLVALPFYVLMGDPSPDGPTWPVGGDFIAFWSAAREVMEGRPLDAWDLAAHAQTQFDAYPYMDGYVPWVYPPPTLILVAPLGLLTHPVAYLVWLGTGITAFVLALQPLLRGRKNAWLILVTFPGLLVGIDTGQIQFFVGALLGGALLMLPRRPALAGVLIGLMVIKPHLALLAPIALLAGRNWRAAIVAGGTSLATLGLSIAILGRASLTAWLDSMGLIGEVVRDGVVPISKMVTPFGLAHRIGLPESASVSLQLVCTVVAATVVYRTWRVTSDPGLRGSALVLGTFLATPYAMDYDLAILAFPIAWLAGYGLDHGWARGERNLLVAMWALPLLATPVATLTHVIVAPLVIGAALWMVWRRARMSADDATSAARIPAVQPPIETM